VTQASGKCCPLGTGFPFFPRLGKSKLIEFAVQDLTVVKDSPPSVLEDHATREVRSLSAAREKEKDVAKTWHDRKICEREVLLKHRHQQRLEGLPKEESPSESASEEEGDDSDDNDARSRYNTVTFLAHLPDVRSLQGPVGGGSTSQASRAASVLVEGEEERSEERAHEGPSERRSTEPGVPLTMSAAPRMHARSPCTLSAGGTATSTLEAGVPSSGVRTRGQAILMTQRTSGTSLAQARGSFGPTRGSIEGTSQGALGSSGKPETKPMIPMSR
jgi:hypothetical protein